MTPNMKIAFGIGVLIAVVGAGYLYLHQNGSENTDQITLSELQSITGKVVSVDSGARKVVITASGVQKTVQIDPATKIQKIVEQKNASGVLEKQAIAEVNIDALVKDSVVTVTYQSVKNTILVGVSTISFKITSTLDVYYAQAAQQQKASLVSYQKGQVVRINTATRKLEYKAYLFNTLSSKVITTSYTATTPVYTVDDPTRVGILHARIPASLADIKPGVSLFLMVDNQALQKGSVVPLAFILIRK